MSLLKQFLVTTLPHEGSLVLQKWKLAVLRRRDAWKSNRRIRNGREAKSVAMSRLHGAQELLAFNPCEILKTKADIDKSSQFLRSEGLVLNDCDCKNWDLAHVLPGLGHGNILDMGCRGSIVLENAQRLGLAGEKVGIDLAALPPQDGITLIQGDLTKTGLPSGHFDYITCLSVIEHGVDVHAFIAECARLLKPGGKLFLTFDYWDPKITSGIRLFGAPWTLFCRNDVEALIKACAAAGLKIAAPMDWTQQDGVIRPGYWAPGNFAYTFGITEFVKEPESAGLPAGASARLKDVLIINHNEPACGVFQFGENLYDSLRGRSSKYAFTLANCANESEVRNAIKYINPVAVIYNWHPATLPFINKEFTRQMGSPRVPALGFYHEITAEVATQASDNIFDCWICGDPTLATPNPFIFKSGRPLPVYKNRQAAPAITTIGTFGFGFKNKGFSRLAAMVQDQFDEAVIKMHVPYSAYFDPQGREARARVAEAKALITKPRIRIDASHKLLSKKGLLDFLAGNSMNAFLYDDMHRGIASTIDYALAVDRPLAISKSYMFRHVWDAKPSILVEENSLPRILDAGIAPLLPYKNAWSASSLVREYEDILDRVMARKFRQS